MLRFNRNLAIATAWAVVIFATSCSFIERSVFINFVKKFIPSGVPQELWMSFWSYFGLLVVKGYHVTEFAVLCWLLQKALHRQFPRRPLQALASAALVALVYASSDERHQTFVPGRGGTWVDVMIDGIGISIATAAFCSRMRRHTDEEAPQSAEPETF